MSTFKGFVVGVLCAWIIQIAVIMTWQYVCPDPYYGMVKQYRFGLQGVKVFEFETVPAPKNEKIEE